MIGPAYGHSEPLRRRLPTPYNHAQIGMFPASQLVRELRDYTIVNLDDLALTP
ncbi:hypothetical protein RKD42_000407 [Streptomyces ambofaciens]